MLLKNGFPSHTLSGGLHTKFSTEYREYVMHVMFRDIKQFELLPIILIGPIGIWEYPLSLDKWWRFTTFVFALGIVK